MKRTIISVFLAVVMLFTLAGAALAVKPIDEDADQSDGPIYNGNGCPSGAHETINIIGVSNPKGWAYEDEKGGNGSRIFVDRSGTTSFFIQADDHFAILDHDGTDGKVGEGNASKVPGEAEIIAAGILLPYDEGAWQVEIYVKLLGPRDSLAQMKGYYMDGDDTWVLIDTVDLDRNSSKFQCATGKLLADGYEDILWELIPQNNFKHLQMRIYPIAPEE